MKGILRAWYEGRFVPYENDPSSGVVFIGGDYERHWSARIARAILEFAAAEWKWLIGTVIAIFALLIAYSKL